MWKLMKAVMFGKVNNDKLGRVLKEAPFLMYKSIEET